MATSLLSMPPAASRSLRKDAAHNRERVIDAARHLFAEHGPDVPLEDIAREADVSRTTLYRNFATREELAAVVYEGNVDRIVQRAAELAGHERGVVELLDFVLELHSADRSLSRMLWSADIHWFEALSARTEAAFAPLLDAGVRQGLVRPGVTVDDIMLCFPMAAGVVADRGTDGQSDAGDRMRRMRRMLHRALFTEEPR